MTKKDYELIAHVLDHEREQAILDIHSTRNGKPSYTEDYINGKKEGVRSVALWLTWFLSDENTRFNPLKFLKACGYEGYYDTDGQVFIRY